MVGTVILWISLFIGVLAIFLAFNTIISKSNFSRKWSRYFTYLFSLIFSLAFILLIYYFVVSDFSIQYVWEHTSKDLPLMYKLSGVWAGKEGSLLLWTWLILFSLAIEEFIQSRKERKEEDEIDMHIEVKYSKARRKLREKFKEKIVLFDYVRFFALIFAMVFLIVLLIVEPFKLTPDISVFEYPKGSGKFIQGNPLEYYPDGYGLNPLLQTPLMAVHPPTTFIGYAFTTLPLASAFAYLITDKKGWTKISLQWSRLSWLFLTLGIGIGGLWAYIVVGWGGYWAWDPVETASLIPWIGLTGFLHAQNEFKKKGSYQIIAPLLAIISFVLIVLATFVTRAGGLWKSVHAFGRADINKTGTQRLFEILSSNNEILAYFLIMIGVLVICGFLIIRKWNKTEEIEEGGEKEFFDYFNNKNFMLITVILFAIITIVILILLFKGIGGEVSPEEFDNKVGIFIIALIVVMGVCLVLKYIEKKNAVLLIILMLIAGGVGMVIYPQKEIGFSVPIFIIASLTSIYRIAMSLTKGNLRTKVKSSSAHLIHLGVVILLIGYVVSQNLITKTDETITLTLNQEKDFNGYKLKLIAINGEDKDNEIGYEIINANIEISKDSKFIGNAMLKLQYFAYNNYYLANVVICKDSMIDLYFSPKGIYDATQENETFNIDGWISANFPLHKQGKFKAISVIAIAFDLETLPLVDFVWFGMFLMSIGIILRTAESYLPKEREDFGKETEEKVVKKEKDYDKLFEEELKELK